MASVIMTIERVVFVGKWAEFLSKDRAVNLTGFQQYDASSKSYMLEEAVRKSGMIDDIRKNGYKGKKIKWVYKEPNWEIDSFVTEDRILTREECLALNIDLYNKAMEIQWKEDKVKKNLSGDLGVCEFCGRKYVISCICDEGQKLWNRTIQEVKMVSNRDRSNENY